MNYAGSGEMPLSIPQTRGRGCPVEQSGSGCILFSVQSQLLKHLTGRDSSGGVGSSGVFLKQLEELRR